MNSTSKTKLEIDPNLYNTFSRESISSKKDRLGFYKKDGSTYVITTQRSTNYDGLNTNIEDLVDVLAQCRFGNKVGEQAFTDLSQTHLFAQYIESVHDIVGRHNEKVTYLKEYTCLWLFLNIPLISSIVHWIFKELTPPETILSVMTSNQEALIEIAFAKAKKTSDLNKIKQEIEEQIKLTDASANQASIKKFFKSENGLLNSKYIGWYINRIRNLNTIPCAETLSLEDLLATNDPNESFQQLIKLTSKLDPYMHKKALKQLYDAYERSVVVFLRTAPDLKTLNELKQQFLEKIGEFKHPEVVEKQNQLIYAVFRDELVKRSSALRMAQAILDGEEKPLDVSLETEPSKAAELCNARTKSLDLSEEVKTLASEEQKELIPKAKRKVVEAYGRWLAARIAHLAQQAKDNGTTPAIGDLLGTQKPEEFATKLVSRIKQLSGYGESNAIEILNQSYEEYLTPLFKTLVESIESRTIFSGTANIKELRALHEKEKLFLLNWHAFKQGRPSKQSEEELRSLLQKLEEANNHRLAGISKIFAEAQSVQGHNRPPESPLHEPLYVTGFSEENIALRTKSESELTSSIGLFKYELEKLDNAEFTEDSIQYIQKAYLDLRKELKRRQEKKLEDQLKDRQKAQSFFSSMLPSFISNFFSDTHEQPLKTYKDKLFEVLAISKESELEAAYQKKLEEVGDLPEAEEMKDKITHLYECYKRAIILQPHIKKVSEGWMNWENISLKKIAERENLSGLEAIEKHVEFLQDLLEKEINIQEGREGGNRLLKALVIVKSQLTKEWDKMLETENPSYMELKALIAAHEGASTGLHKEILGFNLYENYIAVHRKYKDLIMLADKLAEASQPAILREAAINAKILYVYAYKEWEAERIILTKANWDSKPEYDPYRNIYPAKILGMQWDASLPERKKRYFQLQFLLHADKNKDVPEKLLEKIIEAGKLLIAPE